MGAWLKVIQKCDFVDYNVRPPVDGLEGLGEFDVVGVDLRSEKVYICEVVTHVRGMLYGNFETTQRRVREKFARQKKYAAKFLPKHFAKIYMLWSPVVAPKYVRALTNIHGLELVLNADYAEKLDELRSAIKGNRKDFGNPFVRVLQILEILKCSCGSGKSQGTCHGA